MTMVRGSNPGGGEIFRTCPDRPWSPPIFLYNVYRVFPGGKKRPGLDADTSYPYSAVVIKGRAIPLLPLWAVRPVQSLSAYTRVHLPYFTGVSSRQSMGEEGSLFCALRSYKTTNSFGYY